MRIRSGRGRRSLRTAVVALDIALVAAMVGVGADRIVAGPGRAAHGAPGNGGPGNGGPGSGAPGDGAPGDGTPGGGVYLSLGDSLAFGYRPPGSSPAPDYERAADFVGYPEDVGKDLGMRVVDASCPGETVASLIVDTAPSDGCENAPAPGLAYRARYPLHVAYRGSQLAFAVRYLRAHPGRVRLLTVDIGINDVALCVAGTPDGCASYAERQALGRRLAAGLSTIYRAIRTTGGYRGQVVAVTAYPVSYADSVQVDLAGLVDGQLAAVTRRFGGSVADGYAAFGAPSASSGGDPCAAGLLVRLPDGSCDRHPDARGQQLLAAAVEGAARG